MSRSRIMRITGDLVARWYDKRHGLWTKFSDNAHQTDSYALLDAFTANQDQFNGLSFLQELERRGYDLRTLRFRIDKRKEADQC